MLALRLGPAEVRFTGRREGDFGVAAGAHRPDRQRAVVDRVWQMAKQVHGSRVVVVDRSTHEVGEADGLVTADPGVALAVKTADCAPLVLASTEGIVGIAHAGWRGLVDGVIAATAREMRELGATSFEAALGPCIRAECYEFGAADLDTVAARFGDEVRATTATGSAALDVAAGVRAALAELDIPLVHDVGCCTACGAEAWWSHRARAEPQRQASVVWLA